jgi:hypothetical protein
MCIYFTIKDYNIFPLDESYTKVIQYLLCLHSLIKQVSEKSILFNLYELIEYITMINVTTTNTTSYPIYLENLMKLLHIPLTKISDIKNTKDCLHIQFTFEEITFTKIIDSVNDDGDTIMNIDNSSSSIDKFPMNYKVNCNCLSYDEENIVKCFIDDNISVGNIIGINTSTMNKFSNNHTTTTDFIPCKYMMFYYEFIFIFNMVKVPTIIKGFYKDTTLVYYMNSIKNEFITFYNDYYKKEEGYTTNTIVSNTNDRHILDSLNYEECLNDLLYIMLSIRNNRYSCNIINNNYYYTNLLNSLSFLLK